MLLAFFADAAAPCSLSGTVVDSVTGKALAKVEVSLAPFDRERHRAAVTITDAEGRFSMAGLECGQYRLMGRRARYVDARAVTVRLAPGEAAAGITHKLVPTGAIAGTVRDADGEPVPRANVTLAQRFAEPGGARMVARETCGTDDQGNYRFGFLRPGSYYIVAEPGTAPWDAVEYPAKGQHPETEVRTFYPGAADGRLASPVVVAAGLNVTGIDIRMLRARAFRVRGTMAIPDARLVVLLRPEDAPAFSGFVPNALARGPNGEFEFRGIPPGSYRLETDGVSIPVTVATNDVDGIRVLPGAASIQGRVRVEGDESRRITGRVRLEAETRVEYRQIREDGSFSARALSAGRYRVTPRFENAENLYLKSIRWGETELSESGVTVFGAETVAIEVVLAEGGQVAGVVTNAEGEPVAGATVVLVPEPSLRGRGDRFRTAAADLLGRYSVEGVPPGEYTAFAWEDPDQGAWLDPEFLSRFEKRGERVRLTGIERRQVRLRLIEEN